MPNRIAEPPDGRLPDGRLPDGFTVVLDRRARRLASVSGGTSLLGLSPGRLLHLSPTASRLLAAGDRLTVRDAGSAALARRLLDTGIAHPAVPAPPAAEARPAPPADAAPAHSVPAPPARPSHPGVPVAGVRAERDVTVVVPVKDRPEQLRRLLAALAATAPDLAGVIVVDDGSAEPGRCRAVAEAAGARLVRHQQSAGPAAARNTGLAEATSPLVAFLDSDVVPQPGWLAPLLAQLADPAVALAAPRIVGLAGAGREGWLDRYERLRSSLDLGPDPGPIVPRTRIAYVPSAALLVRAALVTGTNGDADAHHSRALFDERMRVAEDVDLCLRLHAAGWRLRYEPAARVAHEHRVRPLAWWTRKAFYGTGAAPLAARHPGLVPPLVLAPWAAGVTLLVGWQRRWSVLAAGVVTGFAWRRMRRTVAKLHDPGATAGLLLGLGLGSAAGQAAGVLTRHWWPMTVLGCVFSRRVRRAALLAAVAEGLYDWYRHRPPPEEPGLDPVRYLVAHRLDDLGYGTGLWRGALQARTTAPLRPVITRRSHTPPLRGT